MEIGEVIVDTPYDNPLKWEPSWRYEVAKAWADMGKNDFLPTVHAVGVDKDITMLRDYMIELHKGRRFKPGEPEYLEQRWIYEWHDSDPGVRRNPRTYLEPLLLTEASYDRIAYVISGEAVEPHVYKMYQRMFFHVRKEDGTLMKGHFPRLNAAAADNAVLDAATPKEIVWRMAGFQLGYSMLLGIWGWRDDSGVAITSDEIQQAGWLTAQSQMFQRLLTDSVSPQDLNGYLVGYTTHARMLRETGQNSNTQDEAIEFVKSILALHVPTMLVAAKDAEGKLLAAGPNITASDLQARFAAQKNVGAQPIDDAGSEYGEKKLDQMMGASFQNKP